MASQLIGLFKKLTWNDFPQKQANPPGPGVFADAALTSVAVRLGGVNLSGDVGDLSLADTITVTISLGPKSFKNSWLSKRTPMEQQTLLAHEEGHYDLGALIARDYFLQVMQLKGNSYADSAALQADLDPIAQATIARIQEVSDDYDTATKNGSDAAAQAKWFGYIKKAFTQPAIPAATTPDGTIIKVEILKVLGDAGEL